MSVIPKTKEKKIHKKREKSLVLGFVDLFYMVSKACQ